MPDWLQESIQPNAELTLRLIALRLVIALALGIVISGVYRITHGKTANDPAALSATLVLLTVIIAMVTLAIGNSVARAFSLVGALAIVRFRTVVEDTRDTAFVIFAVAVGLAVGAGATLIPLVGIPVTALAAILFRPPAQRRPTVLAGQLRVRVTLGSAQPEAWENILHSHLSQSHLVSTATARQGTAIDFIYQASLRAPDAIVSLVAELNRCEGVQEVEFRQG